MLQLSLFSNKSTKLANTQYLFHGYLSTEKKKSGGNMNMNLTFTKPTIQNRTPINFPLYTVLFLYFTLTYNG